MSWDRIEDDDPRGCYDDDPDAEDRGYEARRQEEMDNRLGSVRKENRNA